MIKEGNVLVRVEYEDIELLNNNPKKFWKGVASIGKSAFSDCKSFNGKLVLSNYDVFDNTLNTFMTKPYETRVYHIK